MADRPPESNDTPKVKKVRLNANVPEDLYERYKRVVERRGLTVTAVVIQHMHRYVEEHE
jgi:acetolactate synthase regulatory subunit